MRVYIGVWLVIIALLVSCVEGSVLVKVFTRFTEEIFASLISLIYIWESLSKCFNVSIIMMVISFMLLFNHLYVRYLWKCMCNGKIFVYFKGIYQTSAVTIEGVL